MSNHNHECASMRGLPCDCTFREDHKNPPGLVCSKCHREIGPMEMYFRARPKKTGAIWCSDCENAPDKSRQEFEAWFTERYGPSCDLRHSGSGYLHPGAEARWCAWREQQRKLDALFTLQEMTECVEAWEDYCDTAFPNDPNHDFATFAASWKGKQKK